MSGNWLDSVVLPADIGERLGGAFLLAKARKQDWGKNLQVIFADGGFAGDHYEKFILKLLRYRLEIVNKEPDQKGFSVLPKRWLIEQVFGCWGRNRRLSKDYEQSAQMSRATLQVASLHRFLKCLKPSHTSEPAFHYRKA